MRSARVQASNGDLAPVKSAANPPVSMSLGDTIITTFNDRLHEVAFCKALPTPGYVQHAGLP